MAIKFEQKTGNTEPAKKEVGGKTYVAEEPAADPAPDALPFAKPVRPEKKGQKVRRK